MEVPAGQDGIQRLLAAEKEAQAIVAKARQGALGVGGKGPGWTLIMRARAGRRSACAKRELHIY